MNVTKKPLRAKTKSARRALQQKGYTYGIAAVVLGVSGGHLAKVLTDVRDSDSLLNRIHNLERLT